MSRASGGTALGTSDASGLHINGATSRTHERCGDRGRARSVAETVRPVGSRTAVLTGTGAVVVGRVPLGDSQLTTFIGDVVFARPMAYQVSRRVLEMILSLKEKGGTTTW